MANFRVQSRQYVPDVGRWRILVGQSVQNKSSVAPFREKDTERLTEALTGWGHRVQDGSTPGHGKDFFLVASTRYLLIPSPETSRETQKRRILGACIVSIYYSDTVVGKPTSLACRVCEFMARPAVHHLRVGVPCSAAQWEKAP